ncbi:very short patch repair endonuclease [Nitratireductor luteus]|uniref:very short patch repair endonuclease n=1 Tax=Nitratireductor luteus TaxID=2976980 RepID=UPI002240C4C0|nr:very short patch repair endonuclease [Nitratireductor luteus]
MDVVSSDRRSAMMARIQGRNTKPEMVVRKIAHRLGYRFRLHRRDLPGSPDLVFPGPKKVVFVHGCFWHSHEGCRFAYKPKSNVEFWESKLRKNVERDIRVQGELECMGWDVLIIWECETVDNDLVVAKLRGHVDHDHS